jgi:hypothetical protein
MEKEAETKKRFSMKFPDVLKFALVWTLVFSLLGIAIQSIKSSTLVLLRFFLQNYIGWFGSIADFANSSSQNWGEFILLLLSQWYYFFLTGGLLALLWGIIKWLFSFRINAGTTPITPTEKTKEIQVSKEKIVQKEIEEWLSEGLLLLAEGNLSEAELIYESIKKEYDASKDKARELYNRILDFYRILIGERKK